MADIIKTIESWRDSDRVFTWLTRRNRTPNQRHYLYFFTLGRGHPKQTIERLYFTFQGFVIGWFDVEDIVANLGKWADFVDGAIKIDKATGVRELATNDHLRRAYTWRPKPGVWMVLCPPPFHSIEEQLYYSGFQGFRYFDLDSYRKMPESKFLI